jgi:hypothetical protein
MGDDWDVLRSRFDEVITPGAGRADGAVSAINIQPGVSGAAACKTPG